MQYLLNDTVSNLVLKMKLFNEQYDWSLSIRQDQFKRALNMAVILHCALYLQKQTSRWKNLLLNWRWSFPIFVAFYNVPLHRQRFIFEHVLFYGLMSVVRGNSRVNKYIFDH